MTAAQACACLREAAERNRDDSLRRGSLLSFPDYGQVVMTGDLHGHRRNFQKLQRFCDLAHAGARHVILHELIHEDLSSLTARDTSHELLLEAARWKCEFPDQVHFLLSNHELAQIHRHEISKNGRVVTREFEDSVRSAYGNTSGDQVLQAVHEFIRSYPLGGRTAHRVFLSHSLPGPRELPVFDPSVFARIPNEEDLSERGSAHALVWGRYQTENVLATLRELLDADYFVCGHQPQEMGFEVLHDRLLILASEHNHGVFLPLDLSRPVSMESLTRAVRPFSAVG